MSKGSKLLQVQSEAKQKVKFSRPLLTKYFSLLSVATRCNCNILIFVKPNLFKQLET